MSMNMKKVKNEKEKKSIFSIFKKSGTNINSKKENKIKSNRPNNNVERNVFSDMDNVMDINNAPRPRMSYENEDMLRFIQGYDKKKSSDYPENQNGFDDIYFNEEEEIDTLFEDMEQNPIEDSNLSDDVILDEHPENTAVFKGFNNNDESMYVEDDMLEENQLEDEYVTDSFENQSFDYSSKNVNNLDSDSLFNLNDSEIEETVENQNFVSDMDLMEDINSQETFNFDVNDDFSNNSESDLSYGESVFEEQIDFSKLDINNEMNDISNDSQFEQENYLENQVSFSDESLINQNETLEENNFEYSESMIQDDIEDDISSLIEENFDFDTVDNFEDNHVEELEQISSNQKFKEIDEEKRRRIKENKKRKKERKKAKIRKYIEEAKRLEREAMAEAVQKDEIKENSNNHIFEQVEQNQTIFEEVTPEEVIVEEFETRTQPKETIVEDNEIQNYESDEQTIVEEVNMQDIKSGKVVKVQEYVRPAHLPKAREVVKIEVIVRTEELNSNTSVDSDDMVRSDDSMRTSADYSNYKVNVGINTALNYYNRNDKEKSLKFLKDIAICSYNNKEYMIAYLAIKEIFNNGSKSQFLEILNEVAEAKERQKIEIERLLETINSDAMEDILQRQKLELERFLDTINSEIDRLI